MLALTAALAAQRIDLVDEDRAGRVCPGHGKQNLGLCVSTGVKGACSVRTRTSFSESPRYLAVSVLALTLKNVVWHS
jgi:hypothetical protein